RSPTAGWWPSICRTMRAFTRNPATAAAERSSRRWPIHGTALRAWSPTSTFWKPPPDRTMSRLLRITWGWIRRQLPPVCPRTQIANGWMVAIYLPNYASFHEKSSDGSGRTQLQALADTWDGLARVEPYFHVLEATTGQDDVAVAADHLGVDQATIAASLSKNPDRQRLDGGHLFAELCELSREIQRRQRQNAAPGAGRYMGRPCARGALLPRSGSHHRTGRCRGCCGSPGGGSGDNCRQSVQEP